MSLSARRRLRIDEGDGVHRRVHHQGATRRRAHGTCHGTRGALEGARLGGPREHRHRDRARHYRLSTWPTWVDNRYILQDSRGRPDMSIYRSEDVVEQLRQLGEASTTCLERAARLDNLSVRIHAGIHRRNSAYVKKLDEALSGWQGPETAIGLRSDWRSRRSVARIGQLMELSETVDALAAEQGQKYLDISERIGQLMDAIVRD